MPPPLPSDVLHMRTYWMESAVGGQRVGRFHGTIAHQQRHGGMTQAPEAKGQPCPPAPLPASILGEEEGGGLVRVQKVPFKRLKKYQRHRYRSVQETDYIKLKRKVSVKTGLTQTKLTLLQDFKSRRYKFLDALTLPWQGGFQI
ncbi:Hypp8183 [Branchiostoma lanceolatum]|uniref:Hypp8183 protein n=1 Tax=Branchiostoma lanceolatum TaxID=7740 RepID=A0A8K0EEC1_BRALA|nr:Hypp8183 [Branchiostoma lanceolatum]